MNSQEKKEWKKQLKLFAGVSTLLSSYSMGGVAIGYFASEYFKLPKIISVATGVLGIILGTIKITQWVKKDQ